MKSSKIRYFGFIVLLFLFSAGNAFSQETTIMVRALATDAKFIGTSIGGAQIIIRDVETGEILEKGLTSGTTGDTNLILLSPTERYKNITDEETAGFEATLNIDKPTFVSVEAHAPVNKKQAKVVSSTQLWIIPGKNITGNGIVLDVPGFVIDILSPQTHETISGENEIEIKANIVMMCGCPVSPDGTWDSNNYDIKAMISSEGKQQEIYLESTGKPSTFSGKTKLEKGNYEVAVYAFDEKTGNTGLDKVNIIVN